jgi:Domain of unknown function (DUF4124)
MLEFYWHLPISLRINSMKPQAIILSLCIIFISSNVLATMYKCTDNVGKVSYSSSPCKEGIEEKEIKKPYFNEAIQQQPSEPQDQTSNLEADNLRNEQARLQQQLDDALARNDLVSVAIYSKLLKASYGRGNIGDQSHERGIEMQNRMQSEQNSMENQNRIKQMQIENQHRNELHRMETLQRLRTKGY